MNLHNHNNTITPSKVEKIVKRKQKILERTEAHCKSLLRLLKTLFSSSNISHMGNINQMGKNEQLIQPMLHILFAWFLKLMDNVTMNSTIKSAVATSVAINV